MEPVAPAAVVAPVLLRPSELRSVGARSPAATVPSLIFTDVTAFFLICFVPTEFFGSCVTA